MRFIMSILNVLPKEFNYYICGSTNQRIMDVNQLSVLFDRCNLNYKLFDFSYSAYDYVLLNSLKSDVICITGSTFIVSDMLKYLDKV